LALDEKSSFAHNNLGLVFAERDALEEAITGFRRAVQIDRTFVELNLGKVFAQQDRLADAVQYFQQALRIQPAVAEVHEKLARALTRQGKKEEAI
jgi:tetratricopeptide (TPR) repeat protein